MNKQEYLDQRNAFVNESEALIAEGKLDDAKAKMKEIEALDAKFEEIKLANANLNALKDNTKGIELENKSVEAKGAVQVAALDRKETLSNEKIYENAWAKDMMGLKLSDEEQVVFNDVNKEFRNVYTHDTSNTSVLIPTTVVAGIFKRAEEMYPLFGDARKYAVSGKLSIKKHVSIDAGDASWYAEGTDTADEQNTFGELVLDGHELSKAVTVSWKLRSMSVADFIPYIMNELAERVGAALGNAAANGTGTNQPTGVTTALEAEASTPQVVTYTVDAPADYESITTLVSKVHASYLNGAGFYANNSTIWTVLANITDNGGKPIFIPDASSGGVGRVFGFDVKADAGVADGEVIFGNPAKGYVVNTNEPFSIVTEEHAKARETDYVAYAIVDGGVLDTKAFALLKK